MRVCRAPARRRQCRRPPPVRDEGPFRRRAAVATLDGMKVLVTAASKHGATTGIARAIGDGLAAHGLDVTVAAVEEVTVVDGYDAVVVGSAVYAGHWLKPALQFVERHADALVARPVWLFSSGPVGDPPKPDEEPVDAAWVVKETAAREHRIFAGMLDRSRLSLPEKAVVMALRAPVGDFRNWDDIRAWANGVAAQLRTANC
jgi:menaquinone-dependent protoporphyrinogen oxidase